MIGFVKVDENTTLIPLYILMPTTTEPFFLSLTHAPFIPTAHFHTHLPTPLKPIPLITFHHHFRHTFLTYSFPSILHVHEAPCVHGSHADMTTFHTRFSLYTMYPFFTHYPFLSLSLTTHGHTQANLMHVVAFIFITLSNLTPSISPHLFSTHARHHLCLHLSLYTHFSPMFTWIEVLKYGGWREVWNKWKSLACMMVRTTVGWKCGSMWCLFLFIYLFIYVKHGFVLSGSTWSGLRVLAVGRMSLVRGL